MSRDLRKITLWFPNMFDTNRAVQAQKMTRDSKLWVKIEVELCYPCRENKGATQLCLQFEAKLTCAFVNAVRRKLVF